MISTIMNDNNGDTDDDNDDDNNDNATVGHSQKLCSILIPVYFCGFSLMLLLHTLTFEFDTLNQY